MPDDGFREHRRRAAARFREAHPERAQKHRRDFETAAQEQSKLEAVRAGAAWTAEDLELAQRYDLTARQVASATGRTFAAVKTMRKKLHKAGNRTDDPDDPRIEFDADGWLDEFVAHDADVHFEAMGPGQWWIGVTLPDGREWHINCGAVNPRAATYANCEEV